MLSKVNYPIGVFKLNDKFQIDVVACGTSIYHFSPCSVFYNQTGVMVAYKGVFSNERIANRANIRGFCRQQYNLRLFPEKLAFKLPEITRGKSQQKLYIVV